MPDIPRQGYPNSTLPVVEQSNVPDTIPGLTQIYASAAGAVLAKTGSGAVISLGVSGGASGTVTSVTVTGDGTILSATPSNAVTTSGTMTLVAAPASGNTVLASPSGGGSGTPAYRRIVAADIIGTGSTSGQVLTSTGNNNPPTWQPAPSSTGTVTSVTFTGDGGLLSSTPSAAVTTSGTLTASLAPSSGNTVWASPVGGGSGNASYRKIIAADLTGTGSTSGQVLTSTGAGNSPTWQNVSAGGSGTVTSVGFVGDGTVLSSTPSAAVTSSGNLTATLATIGGNVVLASPANGTTNLPVYRKLINTDLTGTNSTLGFVLTSTGTGTSPTWQAGTPGPQGATGADGPGALSIVPWAQGMTAGYTGGPFPMQRAGTINGKWYTRSAGYVRAITIQTAVAINSGTYTYQLKLNGTTNVGTALTISGGANYADLILSPAVQIVPGDYLEVYFSSGATTPSSWTTVDVTITDTTMTSALAPQNANVVLAGPTSGGPAAPTYRAVLAADMQGTTGSNGQILTSNGSAAPTWQNKYGVTETMNTLRTSDGIVTEPSHTFVGDTGGGMWRNSTAIRFSRAGVEKFNLQASENANLQPISIAGATSGKIVHAAASVTTTHVVTWPATQGAANTVLTNDGIGNLSWAAPAGGSYEFVCLQSGTFQRQQSGAYFMNVGIALSQDVFWYADGPGTIRGARGYVIIDTGSTTVTFTIYKNGVATGLTTGSITANTTVTPWNATGTAVTVVAGDQIGLAIIPVSATPKITCNGHVKIRQP